ncbi:molybdate ABC transporter substrate-binding protein [Tabrizicola sp.]|uniref:molybdate ABC transporter substrate-binding protein n=1 Tax=Tabrizicola sp. TaxID=2005166 RepID=UPI003F2EB716
MLFRTLLSSALLVFPAEAGEVTVFAAASLKTALDQIAAEWQATTGHRVVLSYGGSSALARQIEAGAPADIFLSAAEEWMDVLEEDGLIQPESRRDLLGNQLILVAHGKVAPQAIDEGLDLPGLLGGGRLSMALIDAVPAGQYGKEALESLGLWDSVKDSVAQSDNVRAALKLVELGEASVGIVYASDAVAAEGVTVVGTFPEESHRPITYPAALTLEGSEPEAAAFLDHLETPEAEAIFVANGFRPLP